MHVSRLVKGIVAGGLGLALLIGGGTFALWSSTANVSSATIDSGTLTVTAADGTWANADTQTPTPISDISTYKIVPGDVLVYTTTLTVTAIGNDLKAELSVDPDQIGGDADLIGQLDTTLTVTGTLPDGIVAAGTNTYTVTPPQDAVSVPVTVTITFDPDTQETTGQGEEVDLSDLTFTLEQVTS